MQKRDEDELWFDADLIDDLDDQLDEEDPRRRDSGLRRHRPKQQDEYDDPRQ